MNLIHVYSLILLLHSLAVWESPLRLGGVLTLGPQKLGPFTPLRMEFEVVTHDQLSSE